MPVCRCDLSFLQGGHAAAEHSSAVLADLQKEAPVQTDIHLTR